MWSLQKKKNCQITKGVALIVHIQWTAVTLLWDEEAQGGEWLPVMGS